MPKHPKNKRERLLRGNTKAKPAFETYYGPYLASDENDANPLHTISAEEGRQKLGVLRKTRKLCSSPFCCGNPRRMKGRTILSRQEIIQVLRDSDSIETYVD